MLHMVVEQTYNYTKRLEYHPEDHTFTETEYDSLMYRRNFRQPYGWIRESGTPPQPHWDCILMTERAYEPGDEVEIKVIGMFRRADGDHKYIVVEAERDIEDYDDLSIAEKEDLHRLYPRVGEGEGWAGHEEAGRCVAGMRGETQQAAPDGVRENMAVAQFSEIPGVEAWSDVRLIDKGWSDDRKYLVHTKSGGKQLLRIADLAAYGRKEKEYRIIQKYAGLGFPMSIPLAFGVCNHGQNVYTLLSWVEGEDLESILPRLPEREQYRLGQSAGRILKAIHSLPVEEEDKPGQTKREKKLAQLERYETSNVRVAGDEAAVAYVKQNIHKIWSKPPVYQHGDFHPGNLIYMPDGQIGVIDFNRWEVGDPYEEFYKVESFGTGVSIPYCVGQIDAYFDGNVPEEFWEALAVYSAHAALYSIKWAEKFGQADIDNMTRICMDTFAHFRGFRQCKPVWYDGVREY